MSTWTTREDQRIEIKKMSDSHLINTVRMLRRHSNEVSTFAAVHFDDVFPEEYVHPKLEALEEELKFRKLEAFVSQDKNGVSK